MPGLLSRLRRSTRPEVIVECRRCGTSIEATAGCCPTCGGSGFAEYRIPG